MENKNEDKIKKLQGAIKNFIKRQTLFNRTNLIQGTLYALSDMKGEMGRNGGKGGREGGGGTKSF